MNNLLFQNDLLISASPVTNTCPSLVDDQILDIISGVLGFIGVAGTLYVVVAALRDRAYKRPPMDFILYLSISDVLLSARFMVLGFLHFGLTRCGIPAPDEGCNASWVCIFEAIWYQFNAVGSLMWNAMISIRLILLMYNPFSPWKGINKLSHFLVWGVSISTSIILGLSGSMGGSGDGTCWIRWDRHVLSLRFLLISPLIFSFAAAIVTVIIGAFRIRYVFSLGNKRSAMLQARLWIYCGLFILCWLGPLLQRLMELSNPKSWILGTTHRAGVLVYTNVIGTCMQGVANLILWIALPKSKNEKKEDDATEQNDESKRSSCVDYVYEEERKKQELSSVQSEIEKLNVEDNFPSHSIEAQEEEFNKELNEDFTNEENKPLLLEDFPIRSKGNRKKKKREENLSQQEDFLSFDIVYRKLIMQSLLMGVRETLSKSGNNDQIFLHPKDFSEVDKIMLNLDEGTYMRRFKPIVLFSDYAPKVFHKLRAMTGFSIESYSQCLDPILFLKKLDNQKFSAGRSGSFFCFSPDKKCIIKTMRHGEVKKLLEMLPHLVDYFQNNPNSNIAKFYGMHSISFPLGETFYVIVMENLMNTSLQFGEIYDLKGSSVHRSAAPRKSPVLLDNDFKKKIILSPEDRERLVKQLEADSNFLASQNVMDYSLLFAIHTVVSPIETMYPLPPRAFISSDKSTLYFLGIIDILQSYNIWKVLEKTWKVKILSFDADKISVQEPEKYAKRFFKFLELRIQS